MRLFFIWVCTQFEKKFNWFSTTHLIFCFRIRNHVAFCYAETVSQWNTIAIGIRCKYSHFYSQELLWSTQHDDILKIECAFCLNLNIFFNYCYSCALVKCWCRCYFWGCFCCCLVHGTAHICACSTIFRRKYYYFIKYKILIHVKYSQRRRLKTAHWFSNVHTIILIIL